MNSTVLVLCGLGLAAVAAGCGRVQPPPSAQTQPPLTPAEQIAAAAVELGSPTSLDPAGLEALAAAIGDARIVMLGEPWHGDGGAIRLRAELVRYLHQHLGFDVLVFEADFYSLNEAWGRSRTRGTAAPAAENTLAFWSDTEAAAPLWRYIAEQMHLGDTLHVAGMDVRMRGRLTREDLPDQLHDRLLGLPGVSPPEATRAVRFLSALFNPEHASTDVLTDENYALLVRLLGELERHLAGPPADGFWRQTVESLLRNLRNEPPDPGMAANLIWLATERYPDRKLIVWAHNNHIITDKWMFFESPDPALRALIEPMPEEDVGEAVYTGDVVRQFFGSRLLSIATIPFEGSYSSEIAAYLQNRPADFDVLAVLPPAPEGTLEHAFARQGFETAFADLRPFRGTATPVRSRVLDYTQMDPVALRLWQGYDGVLFMRSTHGLND